MVFLGWPVGIGIGQSFKKGHSHSSQVWPHTFFLFALCSKSQSFVCLFLFFSVPSSKTLFLVSDLWGAFRADNSALQGPSTLPRHFFWNLQLTCKEVNTRLGVLLYARQTWAILLGEVLVLGNIGLFGPEGPTLNDLADLALLCVGW